MPHQTPAQTPPDDCSRDAFRCRKAAEAVTDTFQTTQLVRNVYCEARLTLWYWDELAREGGHHPLIPLFPRPLTTLDAQRFDLRGRYPHVPQSLAHRIYHREVVVSDTDAKRQMGL